MITAAYGVAEQAVSWLGTSQAVDEAVGHKSHPIEGEEAERRLESLRLQLGEAAFSSAWERGRTMPLEAAATEALAIAAALVRDRPEHFAPIVQD